VVLDEIARHHRIGHGPGEQLLDEAMPHGMRPARLARSAQGFGEAFRHDVGPRRRFDHQDSGSMEPRGLRGAGRLAENELARLMKLPRSEKSLSRLTLRSTPPTKEALLLTSTAPSLGAPPAWSRAPGLWWCKHRGRRGADPVVGMRRERSNSFLTSRSSGGDRHSLPQSSQIFADNQKTETCEHNSGVDVPLRS
jgi:hypothetical protein